MMRAWTTVVAIRMGRQGVVVKDTVKEASKRLHSVRRTEPLSSWSLEREDNKKADSFHIYLLGRM